MSETVDLDRLADMHGIEASYISETGEHRVIGQDVKRALLSAMGVSLNDEHADRSEIASRAPTGRCYIPDWLRQERAWGITVQLYGVPSQRNHGIGDFEDAARLAETFGPLGADFLGINPIHALFFGDPGRASPYFPSSRQYINPLYIALDRVEGAEAALSKLTDADVAALRAGTHVDYPRVTAVKRRVLEAAFANAPRKAEFEAYCDAQGDDLDRFAAFEALSEHFVREGRGAGWRMWPAVFRSPETDEVAAFKTEKPFRIRFHKWLQWVAERQLADLQHRARAAGMRIGLYLDLAVGVAPDGAAAWCNPQSYASDARIGAPPDLFNAVGQDWGLAPIKPSLLDATEEGPFAKDIGAAMRSAGAVRIDHAMGLSRLYWIPRGATAKEGGYVRYPFGAMIDGLASKSHAARALVIGEDLGTVAPGFREAMERAGLLGCRVFYFENEHGRFRSPAHYPHLALASLSTHDLAPIRGWWLGRDIAAREEVGKFLDGHADLAREERRRNRPRLMEALAAEGLAGHDGVDAQAMADDHFVALHVFLARTPCALFAIQIEDLAGATEQVNLPGTGEEYSNWRLRLPVALEDLAAEPIVRRTLDAVARERPRGVFREPSG
jgi:4-alpha-glucanotransferase